VPWSCGLAAGVRLVFGLLSWGCQRSAPPSTWAPDVHSQWFRCSEELLPGFISRDSAWPHGATFGPGLPRPGLVPPLPFLPASTACSIWCFAGLLHPAADHGVRHVSGLSGRGARPALPSPAEAGTCGRGVPVLSSRSPRRLPARVRFASCCGAGATPGGLARSRGEARSRFPWTFPNGAPPFGAFPSSAAVPRQPNLSAALLALCRPRADPVSVLCLERDSASGSGHRGRYPLAVARARSLSCVRPLRAEDVCATGGSRLLDLRVFVR
jgi:hypothetical protein